MKLIKSLTSWIKLFFSGLFKVIFPFIAQVVKDEADGLLPIVEETIEAIAALPNYNQMSFLECLGAAVPRIEAKALEVLKKDFSKTQILNMLQVVFTEKQVEAVPPVTK